jgi:hypothetical protein
VWQGPGTASVSPHSRWRQQLEEFEERKWKLGGESTTGAQRGPSQERDIKGYHANGKGSFDVTE